MKTILTPVDFSGITELVVAEATALAQGQKGRIILVNIIQPPIITAEYAPYLENIAEIISLSERTVAKQLARLEMRLKDEGVAAETLMFNGDPVKIILDQARELEADYIVMGSHGHTAFYDLLVGSTTHGVLLKSPCPVLIVPAPKKKAAKPRK
jgi:nucleotide-binding universal stress UspA family protein